MASTLQLTGVALIAATASIFAYIGYRYAKRKTFTIESFISARNSLPLGIATATLVASGMGAWILFGPAEAAVIAGLPALIGYALGSAAAVWIFILFGLRLKKLMPNGHGLTEYVYHRYGKAMYALILVISIFYMAVYLTAELTGIALAGMMVFQVPALYTIFIIGTATIIYTALGGFLASVFTDKIQSWIILPLLAVIFIGTLFFLGGFTPITDKALASSPDLFNWRNISGIEYGITLLIAIIGAEVFNQGNWQRVYAAKNKGILIKAFLLAGLIIIPIIFVVGAFGIFAVSEQVAENVSVSLFTLISQLMPAWIVFLTMILAVALVMSSMDTLLNGLVSIFTIDFVRLKPEVKQEKLMVIAKVVTVVIALVAMIIATQSFSVLYLFLVADLVCVAAAFPTFFGLYSKKFSGQAALITTLIGIMAGAVYFPDPSFSRGNLLVSFAVALILPAILAPFARRYGHRFDFKILRSSVQPLGKLR